MIKNIPFTLLLISVQSVCLSQIPEKMLINANDIPGAQFSAPRTFNGASLFGYMDGGAELYLEYGFSDAVINEITYQGEKYKTEIFRMNGPEEAFGIFSVSKYHCVSLPDITNFACQTKYQLQFSKGPYYVSIINRRGNAADSAAMLKIGRIIAGRISGPDFDFQEYLPSASAEDLQNNCFIAKGKLGIVNGSPDLEDYFQNISDYTALILRKEDSTVISVKFSDENNYKKFLVLHKWDKMSFGPAAGVLPDGGSAKLISQYHLWIKTENDKSGK